MRRTYLYLWLFMSAFTLAQLQTFAPFKPNEITFSVNVPEATASSGSGPIFIQLKSTHELQWFAWGEGTRMQGANIFIVYASGNGQNVTVSPRLGIEHVEPKFNPQARISVLSGSGISNGTMTANIRCDSCITWPGGTEDPTSSASSWVWAVKYGSPLNTNSVSAQITIHDYSGIASLDLKQATGGSSVNPFAATTGVVSSSGHAISSINSGSIRPRRFAHAVIMIVVFVVLLPSFALMLRVIPSSKIVDVHACLQLFTLSLAIAGLGIGISMARSLQYLHTYHPIIGMVVVSSLVVFQPAMGFLQHRHFHKTGDKSAFAYIHRWLGRCLIVLGIINAGLGFHLAQPGTSYSPTGAIIAYAVVAGLVGIAYVLGVVFLPREGPGRTLP